MKNWLSALFGSCARAIETVPRTCFVVRELGLQLVARAAGAGAGRVAGLRHEPVDDAMERHPVIKAAPRQRLDLRDMVRREVGPHRDDDTASRDIDIQRVFQISRHGRASRCNNRKSEQQPAQ